MVLQARHFAIQFLIISYEYGLSPEWHLNSSENSSWTSFRMDERFDPVRIMQRELTGHGEQYASVVLRDKPCLTSRRRTGGTKSRTRRFFPRQSPYILAENVIHSRMPSATLESIEPAGLPSDNMRHERISEKSTGRLTAL